MDGRGMGWQGNGWQSRTADVKTAVRSVSNYRDLTLRVFPSGMDETPADVSSRGWQSRTADVKTAARSVSNYRELTLRVFPSKLHASTFSSAVRLCHPWAVRYRSTVRHLRFRVVRLLPAIDRLIPYPQTIETDGRSAVAGYSVPASSQFRRQS
jgi:hypothetical protein